MKKTVRFIVWMVVIVIAAVLILGIIAPSDVIVTRSIVIKAPRAAVMEHIARFKSWPAWSPWQEKDSAMKVTYNGDDGSAGSGYHWVGDEKKVGEGEMKSTNVNDTEMDFTINIIKPWEMAMNGYFKVTDTGVGMSKVTWSTTKHTSYPFNASCLFVSMDKYLGGDFELGLGKLKKAIENDPLTKAAAQIEIKEVDFAEHTYQGFRKVMPMADMMKFFGESFGNLAPVISKKITGPSVSIFYTWDMASMTTDVLAAFPVSDSTVKIINGVYAHVPASKAYLAVQHGGYSGAMAVHSALKSHLASKGQTAGMMMEEYLVSPHETADSNQWVTNVYYFVK